MWTYEEFPYECKRLASIAFERYGKDLAYLHLVGIKRMGRWATALVSHDIAEGESYIIADPLPRNLNLAALTDWIQERLRREPVLREGA
jgi:hypothetical protein